MRLPKNAPPVTPGELLQEGFLDELGVTQLELAGHLGWTPAKVNEIVRGKRRITVEIALALADAFQTSPDFWLNAQRATDLHKAMAKYQKRPPLRKAS